VRRELGAALEEGEFDEHRDAQEVGTEFVEQLDRCGRGAAGGEQVVHQQDVSPGFTASSWSSTIDSPYSSE
jgi:hypothetical protein